MVLEMNFQFFQFFFGLDRHLGGTWGALEWHFEGHLRDTLRDTGGCTLRGT